MNRVDHAPGAVGRPECSFGSAPFTIPDNDVAAFFLGELTDDLCFKLDANRAGEHQGFIVGHFRSVERVPGEDEPRGHGVEFFAGFRVRQLFQAPAFDLAASGIERVFGGNGVWVPFLAKEFRLRDSAAALGLRSRGAAPERPMARELFERRTEGGEIEIDASDSGLLEFRNAGADGLRDQRLDVLPIDRGVVASIRPRAGGRRERWCCWRRPYP